MELPAFARRRDAYLDDDAYRALQAALIANPRAGAPIRGAGGLRKLRWQDPRRGKGRRGGLRVLYYWMAAGLEIWLFGVYDKDKAADLTTDEKKVFRTALQAELGARRR